LRLFAEAGGDEKSLRVMFDNFQNGITRQSAFASRMREEQKRFPSSQPKCQRYNQIGARQNHAFQPRGGFFG
jgi:hypothetical protein